MKNLIYDGSFEGFLTAVFTAFEKKITKSVHITRRSDEQSLFECLEIATDLQKYTRVKHGIETKLSFALLDDLYAAFLSHLPQIEDQLLAFIVLGFEMGKDIRHMRQHPVVDGCMKAAAKARREAHRFLGFVRFRQYHDLYISDIEPDFDILPLIAEHFINRFASQPFLIRDARSRTALVYNGAESMILSFEQSPALWEVSPCDEFENLFKTYYDAMAIEERKSKKRAMRLMPQKYWKNLPEKSVSPKQENKVKKSLEKGSAL